LGGSSTINGLIYIRGNVQGFNKIAKNVGEKRWELENILRIYKKLEDYDGWFDDGVYFYFKSFTFKSSTELILFW
jgi:choline dehydrogenase